MNFHLGWSFLLRWRLTTTAMMRLNVLFLALLFLRLLTVGLDSLTIFAYGSCASLCLAMEGGWQWWKIQPKECDEAWIGRMNSTAFHSWKSSSASCQLLVFPFVIQPPGGRQRRVQSPRVNRLGRDNLDYLWSRETTHWKQDFVLGVNCYGFLTVPRR